MAKQEMYIPEQKKGIVDRTLDLGKKTTWITMPVNLGMIAAGAAFGIPPLVATGAVGTGVDIGQYAGIKYIEKRRKQKRQEKALHEQLGSQKAVSQESLFKKVKDSILPRTGTIYQRSSLQTA